MKSFFKVKYFSVLLAMCLIISGIIPNYAYATNTNSGSAMGASSSDISVEPVIAYPGVAAVLESGADVTLKTATPDAQIFWIKYPLGGERPNPPFNWEGMKWTPNSEVTVTIDESCVIECYAEVGTSQDVIDLSKAKRSVMSVFTYIVQENDSAVSGVVSSHASGSVLSPGTIVTLTTGTPGAIVMYRAYPTGKRPGEPFIWESNNTNSISVSVGESITIEAFAETGVSGNTTDLPSNHRSETSLFVYTVSSQSSNSPLFLMREDNYNFSNSAASFSYPYGYSIPIERFETLWGKSSNLWNPYHWDFYFFYSQWGGSCFGFSSSSLRFNAEHLSTLNYQANAKKVYDFTVPKSVDSNVTKLLELHQISQFLTPIQNEISKNYDSYQALVDEMYTSDGKGVLLAFYFSRGGMKYGHAVVAYDIKSQGNNIYTMSIYDNNYPDDTPQIEINVGRKTFAFKGTVNSGQSDYNYGIPENLSFVRTSVQNSAMENLTTTGAANNLTYIAVPSANAVIRDSNGRIMSNMSSAVASVPLNASQDVQINQPVVWTLPAGTYTVELSNYLEAKAYQNVTFFDDDSSISIRVCGTNLVVRGTSSGEGQIDIIGGIVNTNEESGKEITPVEIFRSTSAAKSMTNIFVAIGNEFITKNGVRTMIDPLNLAVVPYISEDGRTMIPVRAIAEAIGAQVDWSVDTRTVTIIKGGTKINLVIDTPLPDGMGTAVLTEAGRVFVPIRYVAEMFGAEVKWDVDNQTATINIEDNK